MRVVRLLALAALAALAAGLAVDQPAEAASADKGKVAYVKHGCWQCHGFVGQGAVTGPKLAPNPMPLPELAAIVRFTTGEMPPYQKALLSDEDLADIHAWLQSLPKAPDYKSIPLLNP